MERPGVVRILGVPVQAQRFETAVERLVGAVSEGRRIRAHFATVHSIVEATSDPSLQEAFESADMVFADGMPLVWVSRARGFRKAERVCGPDMLLALADRGRAIGLRHYFLGGVPGTPELLAGALTERFPGLRVAGGLSPPFRPQTDEETEAMLAQINGSAADVVWVGLGAPKQELWARRHQGRLDAALLLPIGAAFDFYSGRRMRAPRWMQRIGLEWLFRLASEPRRLGTRYLTTNARFLWLLVAESARSRKVTGRQ